jgi:hypothetical protein
LASELVLPDLLHLAAEVVEHLKPAGEAVPHAGLVEEVQGQKKWEK